MSLGATLVVVNPGAPVAAGDTLWLRSGYHGELFLRGAYNAAPITVAAAPGELPRLRRVWLSAAQNWIVRGLSISPSHAPGPLTQDTMVFVENHGWHGPSWDIEIADCDLFTVDDASSWGENEWVNDAASAFRIDGDRVRCTAIACATCASASRSQAKMRASATISSTASRPTGCAAWATAAGSSTTRSRTRWSARRRTATTTTASRAGRWARGESAPARCATSCCAATGSSTT